MLGFCETESANDERVIAHAYVGSANACDILVTDSFSSWSMLKLLTGATSRYFALFFGPLKIVVNSVEGNR